MNPMNPLNDWANGEWSIWMKGVHEDRDGLNYHEVKIPMEFESLTFLHACAQPSCPHNYGSWTSPPIPPPFNA